MFDQSFTKSLAFHCLVDRFLVTHACHSSGTTRDNKTFMIEIGGGHCKTFAFLSNQVGDRNFDILQRDKGGAMSRVELRLHLSDFDARHGPFQQQQRYAPETFLTRSDSCCEIRCHCSASNPFLGPVNDVIVALTNG
eukprot:Lithocolla_globosa_v1_NODE_4458_length_1430_cov_21.856000.p3 type:complete len:137 gc:universal NODE_4458_length_1430_cov_21.856000:426-836(+)